MAIHDNIDWTISQTFAWICMRTPEFMERVAALDAAGVDESETQLGTISPVVTILETALPPELILSIDAAESQLKRLLSSGSLRCSGVRGTRHDLPTSGWRARSFLLATDRVTDATENGVWTDVLFRCSDILQFWPAMDGDSNRSGRPANLPGPKPGQPSPYPEWMDFALRLLESGEVSVDRSGAEIARRIKRELAPDHKLNTIEKAIRPVIQGFRKRKFPEVSGKSPPGLAAN